MNEHSIIVVTNSHKDFKKLGHKIVNIIGAFDGVDAVLWEEKHYMANEPTIPSSQPIIFIGETKTASMILDSIQEWKYEKLNMNYGWIGNKAVIFVNNKHLSQDEINTFKELTNTQKEDIEKGNFFKEWSDKITNADMKDKLIGLAVVSFFSAPLAAAGVVYTFIKKKIDANQIHKEQYEYLVNEFIANGSREFIGI